MCVGSQLIKITFACLKKSLILLLRFNTPIHTFEALFIRERNDFWDKPYLVGINKANATSSAAQINLKCNAICIRSTSLIFKSSFCFLFHQNEKLSFKSATDRSFILVSMFVFLSCIELTTTKRDFMLCFFPLNMLFPVLSSKPEAKHHDLS